MREHHSLVATLAAAVGIACLALIVMGVVGANRGVLLPFVGFRLFSLGLLGGIAALVLGVAGLLRTRPAAARPGRGRAWLGTLLGGGLVGALLVLAVPARELPRINDITTDPANPPDFHAAARDPANAGRDLSYPGERFARQQRAAYPDLGSIRLTQPPTVAFERARRAAEALGWTITHTDPGAGTIEAIDVSRLFRFADDVAIRVRGAAGGSLIDLRSKSRDGIGDLGVNAERIRAFVEALRQTR